MPWSQKWHWFFHERPKIAVKKAKNFRNFRNKSLSIFMLHKVNRNKKYAPILIFSNEIFFRKIRMIFDTENRLWKSDFVIFLRLKECNYGFNLKCFFIKFHWHDEKLTLRLNSEWQILPKWKFDIYFHWSNLRSSPWQQQNFVFIRLSTYLQLGAA